MAVTMYVSLAFVIKREGLGRQRLKCPSFHFLEYSAHLFLGCAVYTGIGHIPLPLDKKLFLFE